MWYPGLGGISVRTHLIKIIGALLSVVCSAPCGGSDQIINEKTSNNQRLQECGRQRPAVQTLLPQHCALREFHVSDGQNKARVIRLRGVEGRNARDQIAFFRSAKSKRILGTYMRRMRNDNLEIRIAGSSCRPH